MHSKVKNDITGVLLALLMLFGMAAGVLRTTGSVSAAEDYHTWNQMDSRWGSVPMGNTTVSRSGCLITSLAIMARASGSLDSTALKNMGISSADQFDPGVLAKAYTARNGFSSGGGIASWGTISQIIPSITFLRDAKLSSSNKHGMASEIKTMLDSGIHVIVNVNGHHWVYIEGVIGDDIYMIDPANGAGLVSDHYSLSGQNEYWALKGKNPPAKFTAPYVPVPETTTTTSTSTTTTTTTTVALSTQPVRTLETTVEYYYEGEGEAIVYGQPAEGALEITSMKNGYVTKVSAMSGGYGLIENNSGVVGWVIVEDLTEAVPAEEKNTGDINGDNKVDMYDLSLLSEHIKCTKTMPLGISVLNESELRAADVNGDGNADDGDVLVYLMLLCS